MKQLSTEDRRAAYAAMRETETERKARYDRGDFGLTQDQAKELLLAIADAIDGCKERESK